MNEPIFQFTDEHNDTVSYFKDGEDLTAELVRGDLQRQSYDMTAGEMLDKIAQVENDSNYRITVPISDEDKASLEDMEKGTNDKDITD